MMRSRTKSGRNCLIAALLPLLTACLSDSYEDRMICPTTDLTELTEAVAPAAGAYPVWMVDGSYGRWPGAGTPVKTVWVIARDTGGDLQVVARHIDGKGLARFHLQGSIPTDELVIPNASKPQMLPGGANQTTLDTYAFRSSGIYYSHAGCWEFAIDYNGTESSIIVDIN